MSAEYDPCVLCQNHAEYSCSKCGERICATHARIRVICSNCVTLQQCEYEIHQAFREDTQHLKELVKLFWGDPIQLMFNQHFTVTDQPAIVAKSDNKIVGFAYYTLFQKNAVLIVALGVLPEYHGCGIGNALLTHIEKYARVKKRQRLLVVTTNDNLPALAFYQQAGFQLFEVAPNTVAEKLGGIQLGVANIPIRDELRLQKRLS